LENFLNLPLISYLAKGLSLCKVINSSIQFSTKSEIEFIDLSDKIQDVVSASGIKNGLVHVFAPHATGVLILTENDPALLQDILDLLERLAPSDGNYNHPENAYSHLRSIIFPPDKTLPIVDGQVAFGTWQSLLFVETDNRPRNRTVNIQVIGET
jgi:secondary thiamine-phosphate synthase enzyme